MLLSVTEFLFVSFASGYFFIHFYKPWALTKQYLKGSHFYYRALIVGVPFYLVSMLVLVLTFHWMKSFAWLLELNSRAAAIYPAQWFQLRSFGFTFAVSSMMSILLALALTRLVIKYKPDWEAAIVYSYGTGLQKMLLECQQTYRRVITSKDTDNPETIFFVEVVLSSGKSYIGLPLGSLMPDELNARDYIEILPIFSGYRKKDTHELVPSINYTQMYFVHYEGDLSEDVKVTIDLDKIDYARWYRPELSQYFESN
ncbi:hypothetical protein NFC81_09220 [Salinispirillum sp. LH 10-3-1]|uniref:Uncharacterized protein n=1 Tax=Salinispirillum sp. LH 10-3-1 TaxID=2952525 RepID=A0AB38YCV0_9GAMM